MNSYLEVLASNALPYAAEFVAVALGLVSIWVLKKVAEKLGIDTTNAVANSVWNAANQAVAYAEEWAQKQVKYDPANIPSGAQKLDRALQFLRAQIDSTHIDQLGLDQVTKLLEAALNVQRPDMQPPAPAPAPAPTQAAAK